MSQSDVWKKYIEYAWEGGKRTYYLSDGSGSKDGELILRRGRSNQYVLSCLGSYM